MKILNVNINGLQSKHKNLIDYINKNNFEIINLQEVKITKKSEVINILEKQTKSCLYLNSKRSQHGVATLVRNNIINFKIKNVENKEDE